MLLASERGLFSDAPECRSSRERAVLARPRSPVIICDGLESTSAAMNMHENDRYPTPSRRPASVAAMTILLLAAVASTAQVRAQQLFAELRRSHLPADEHSEVNAIGDVDGDGDLDLVVATPLRLLVNNGAGIFVEASAQRLP